MKRKFYVFILAFALLIPLLGLLGINLYIQSQAFQTTLEKTLEQRWGLRIDLREATFTPWSGLSARGSCPGTRSVTSRHCGGGTCLHADLEILPLLDRQIILRNVQVYEPHAEWVLKGAGSGWTLQAAEGVPLLPAGAEPDAAVRVTGEAGPSDFIGGEVAFAETGSRGSSAASGSGAEGEERSASFAGSRQGNEFEVQLNDIEIINGQLIIRTTPEKVLVSLAGVNLRMAAAAPGRFAGEMTVDHVSLWDSVTMSKLRSPVRYENQMVDFSRVSAEMAHGEVHGNLKLRDVESAPRFDLNLDMYGVHLATLLRNVDDRLKFEKGSVEGGLRMQGQLENIDQAVGTGELIVTEARVSNDTLLASIGQLFEIEELSNILAEKVVLGVRMGDGRLRLEKARIESENLVCSALGEVAAEGALDLRVQLMLGDKLSRKIPQSFLSGFRDDPESGFATLDFSVLGDLSRPRTNLLDQLFPNKDVPVGSFLQLLFPGQEIPAAPPGGMEFESNNG
jgi:hypothetical protein